MHNYVKVDPSIVNKICTEALVRLLKARELLLSNKDKEEAKHKEILDSREAIVDSFRSKLTTEDQKHEYDRQRFRSSMYEGGRTCYYYALDSVISETKALEFESSLAMAPYLLSPDKIALLRSLKEDAWTNNIINSQKEFLDIAIDNTYYTKVCQEHYECAITNTQAREEERKKRKSWF